MSRSKRGGRSVRQPRAPYTPEQLAQLLQDVSTASLHHVLKGTRKGMPYLGSKQFSAAYDVWRSHGIDEVWRVVCAEFAKRPAPLEGRKVCPVCGKVGQQVEYETGDVYTTHQLGRGSIGSFAARVSEVHHYKRT